MSSMKRRKWKGIDESEFHEWIEKRGETDVI